MTSEVTVAASADIVVGLISHNDAAGIRTITQAVRSGLRSRVFAGRISRVVLADCGSTDDTVAAAREVMNGPGELLEVPVMRTTVDMLEQPYHRIPGKARALQAILGTAHGLSAQACAVLDAGVATVSPEWLELLAGPVLADDVDLVSPYYRRHPYEGALTKGIVYPMFRALYGVRLRQPAASEFACSSRLLNSFLAADVWDRDGAQVGIDLWLATAAVSGEFRLAEASLGTRTSRAGGEGAPDLATTVSQVVGSLFADLELRVARWQRVRGSISVPLFGQPCPPARLAAPAVDPEKWIDSFRLGYQELRDIWTWILPPRTIVDLRRLMDSPIARFRLDDELWARIVYDFALGYRLRALARDHLLRSLVPLYLAWLASFILQVRDLSEEAVEERIDKLGAAFEAQKPYLISNWRWPERLRM